MITNYYEFLKSCRRHFNIIIFQFSCNMNVMFFTWIFLHVTFLHEYTLMRYFYLLYSVPQWLNCIGHSLPRYIKMFFFLVPFYTLTDYVLFVLLDNFLVQTWVWCWMAWLRKFLYWIASWTQGSSCGYWSIKVHLCRKYLHDNQHWSS